MSIRINNGATILVRCLLSLVVMTGVACSLFYLIAVPMMQQPDENAHADYAYQLFDIGHPYRVDHPRFNVDVTPEVRYLESRTNFFGMRLEAAERVPPTYGSSGLYRSIDLLAPRQLGALKSHEMPYAMATYPVGYYAVVAAVMRIVYNVTQGSLVATFFAGRALSTVSLAACIVISFDIFTLLGFDTRRAMLLTFIFATLPVVSWVCAYIQPDVFVLLCTTLALDLTLKWIRRSGSFGLAMTLVLIILAELLIKPYYATITAIACVMAIWGSKSLKSERRFAIAALLISVPVGYVLSTRLTPVGLVDLKSGPLRYLQSLASAADTAGSAFTLASRGVVDVYVSGDSFHRFWNALGWRDTAFLPKIQSTFLETVIGMVSTLVFILVAWYRIRLLSRLTKVGGRRGFVSACRLAANDCLWNLYVLWTLFLILSYVVFNGDFSLQGRYWIPVVIAMLVMSVRDVPRCFPRRHHRAASNMMFGFWFAYLAVAVPAGMWSVRLAFYAPDRTAGRVAVVRIDRVVVGGDVVNGDGAVRCGLGQQVKIFGLALRSGDGRPVDSIELLIDGNRVVRAKYGLPRIGINSLPRLLIGYEGSLKPGMLNIGRHRVEVRARVGLAFAFGRKLLIINVVPESLRKHIADHEKFLEKGLRS